MFRELLATSLAAGLAAVAITAATHKEALTTSINDAMQAEAAVRQEMTGPVDGILTLFGADWCGWCKEETAYLQRQGIQFRYVKARTQADVDNLYAALEMQGVAFPPGIKRGLPLTINKTPYGLRAAIGFIRESMGGQEVNLSYFSTSQGTRQRPLTTLLP